MSKSDLNPKNVKPRMRVLRVLPYKGSMVYIRQVNQDIFMYDLIFKNEIYSSYMVFTPGKNKDSLSKAEVDRAASLIWSGAVATIESLLGTELKGEKKKVAEVISNLN